MNREDRRAYAERVKAKFAKVAKFGWWSKDKAEDKKFVGKLASRCIALDCRCKMCKVDWEEKAAKKNKPLPAKYYEE